MSAQEDDLPSEMSWHPPCLSSVGQSQRQANGTVSLGPHVIQFRMHVIFQVANEDGTHAPFAQDEGTANVSIDHGDRSLTLT